MRDKTSSSNCEPYGFCSVSVLNSRNEKTESNYNGGSESLFWNRKIKWHKICRLRRNVDRRQTRNQIMGPVCTGSTGKSDGNDKFNQNFILSSHSSKLFELSDERKLRFMSKHL